MAENEKRRAERIYDKIETTITVEGSKYECEIHNYSESGAYIKFKDSIPPILRLNIIGQKAQIVVSDAYREKIPDEGRCIRLVSQEDEEFIAFHFPPYVNYLKQINE